MTSYLSKATRWGMGQHHHPEAPAFSWPPHHHQCIPSPAPTVSANPMQLSFSEPVTHDLFSLSEVRVATPKTSSRGGPRVGKISSTSRALTRPLLPGEEDMCLQQAPGRPWGLPLHPQLQQPCWRPRMSQLPSGWVFQRLLPPVWQLVQVHNHWNLLDGVTAGSSSGNS